MIIILLQMNPDIQSALLFISMLAMVWAIFLVFHKRGNSHANKFLAVLISVLAVFIFRRTADMDGGSFILFLYFISQGITFLIGPAIYFHIQHLLNGTVSQKTWKHLTPAFGAILLMTVLFFYRSGIDKVHDFSLLKIGSIIFISLQVIHLLFYLFISRKLVAVFERKAEAYYSSLSRINLKWTRQLIILTTILGAGVLSLHILIVTGGYYEINNTADLLFLLLLAAIVLNIIYRSWKQPEIVSGMYEDFSKYKTSLLSGPELAQLKDKLEETLKSEKVFLTHELNINQLANLIGTRSYLLSQVLNEYYKENFFNFINRYRIDFAVNQIEEGNLDKITLEALAYESGFNSKSTFNRAFRKKMGCSPSEYRRSMEEV